MNKKTWFTLVELVVSSMLLVIIVVMFGTILKQVVIFIEYSKQQFAMLNEVTSIKQSISEVFSNKKIKLLKKESNSYAWVYSIKDIVWEIDYANNSSSLTNNQVNFDKFKSKDVLIFEDKNQNINDIYIMWTIDKKSSKLLYDDNDSSWFFGITKLWSWVIDMNWVYDQSFWTYINPNLNILWFRYTLINSGSFLRIDIDYDNNVFDDIKAKDNKEFYYSWSLHVIKKLD